MKNYYKKINLLLNMRSTLLLLFPLISFSQIGTNQEFFDLFIEQGAAGLYKRFNRTPDLIASAQ